MLLRRLALLLPLLASCASDPVAPTPPKEPAASTPSTPAEPIEAEAAPETQLDASFLVGAWAPLPDIPAIDAKVDALLGGELTEQEAVMMSYLARFVFRADGSCEYGISDRGNFMGSTFEWSAEQVDPHTLRMILSLDGVEVSEPLAITRLGDEFHLSGDPTLDGSWVPIPPGEDAAAIDDVWGSLGVEHLKYREQIASANAQIEDSLAKRKDGLETLVTLVKTVCEGEDLIGSTDRTAPIRGDDFLQLRDSLTSTESALLQMPLPSAPKSPVLAEHESSAQAFDEAWLSGS